MKRVALLVVLVGLGTCTSPLSAQNRRTAQPGVQGTAINAGSAAAVNANAAREEAKIASSMKWIQQQLEREEQLLRRRLQAAEALRAKGLKTENSKLLRQAEQTERQAFTAYQQRLNQLEQIRIQSSQQAGQKNTQRRTMQRQQPVRPTAPQAPATTPKTSSTRQPAATTQPTNTRNRWWPFTR